MTKETKLRIYNITAKMVLKFSSEAWVLKKKDEQGLAASQMKFVRQLLGITKLDQEKNQSTNCLCTTLFRKYNITIKSGYKT